MSKLVAWLEEHGLGQYAEVLSKNDIDLDVLPHLSDDDLKELGLSLGHRRKFLAALHETPLVEATAPIRATAHALDDEAERRQLTVMFCDLVGSTELSQEHDPEELRNILRCYHDAVTGAIASHGGHVAKLLGDGVLAYFGWPHAQEDDAERAILAALAAVDEVRGIEAGETALAARAGIATGPVVIGDMRGQTAQERGSIAGATPNLAARLQGTAAPGEVVIHSTTRKLVGATFDFQALGSKRLKGFADPVEIWRVVGIAHKVSRFEALHGGGLTAFVGREHDIGLLLDRWRLALEGEGQVVLLSGEAGIGKSRVLREFSNRLDGEDCRWLRYQCSPHEINSAFQPIISEIEDSAGYRLEDSTEDRLDKLERHLAAVPAGALPTEAAALFATLIGLPTERYPPIEMTPQRLKQRTVTLLAERLARLAQDKPLIVQVEDIHWADPSTLEVLDAIVAWVQDLPVLVIMTFRPELQSRWGGSSHVTLHSLNRLGRSDGRIIAERVAGGKALPTEVLTRIVEQTDGIPLFVEELTKSLLEAGILKDQGDQYVLTGPLPTLAIPATLQDSLMARLDRLAPVKRTVQAAACIGREFGVKLLAAALPITPAELDDALAQLLAAELIFRQGGAGEEERYIFKHALVQDAAYASMLTPVRRGLHERLASALDKADDPDPLELARHFLEAAIHDRAAELYLSVGQRALRNNALPEAIGALELGLRAVEALPPSKEHDRMQLDLRVALGTARMANFGWAHPSVSEALEPAFPLARTIADEDALGSILWGLWVHYQTRTNFPQAHEWLDRLEKVAQDWPQSDLPLIFDMSAGCQYFWEADYTRALRHTDQLKSVYDTEKHARITDLTNHDPLVFSQHWAGSLAEWIAGRPDRSVERLDEAVTLARKIGHPFNLVFALTAGATSLIYLDQTDRLLAHCDEAASVAAEEALGPFSEHVNIMQWRGGTHVQRGDYELGYALAKRGNDFWTDSGGRICTAMFRSWIVRGLQGLGRIEEAAALNAGNISHCRETGDCYMEPECLRLHGELELFGAVPNHSVAERLFREALSIAGSQGARSWELRAAMSLARLLQGRDQRKEALALLVPVLESFKEGLDTTDCVEARTLIALLD
jgi:class 3 adenylate cyclase/predicted ATPase